MKDTGSVCYINNVVTQEYWHKEFHANPQGNNQPWFSRTPMRLTLWPNGKVSTTRDVPWRLTPTDEIEDGWRVFKHDHSKGSLYRVREEDYQRLLSKAAKAD